MRTDHGEHCNECHPELHRSQCLTGGCVAATEFHPCAEAPIGIVTNCAAMECEGKGCAVANARAAGPVSLDDLVMDESDRERVGWESAREAGVCGHCHNYWDTPGHFYGCPDAADELHRLYQEEGL